MVSIKLYLGARVYLKDLVSFLRRADEGEREDAQLIEFGTKAWSFFRKNRTMDIKDITSILTLSLGLHFLTFPNMAVIEQGYEYASPYEISD